MSRPGWLEVLARWGFVTVFALVSLVYGLRFGNELLQTQRDGIAAINRIETFEQEQVYQLRLLSERMDRIEARLIGLEAAAQGPPGGSPP